jgi:hypothetical protein
MPPPAQPPGDYEALLAALAEDARSGSAAAEPEPEPEPEELLDFLDGRLEPEAAERIERRLVASPETARALLDLAELEAAGAAAGEQPAELPVRAAWRDFQHRLPKASPRPRRLLGLLSAIAASLLVATIGLGSWVWRLQGLLETPVANLPSLELPSAGRAIEERTIALAPGAPLRLVLAPAELCPGYVAELEGPGRGKRTRIEGRLERDDLGRLSLLLRPEPGAYTLRLSGCTPRRVVEEHGFRVTRGDG